MCFPAVMCKQQIVVIIQCIVCIPSPGSLALVLKHQPPTAMQLTLIILTLLRWSSMVQRSGVRHSDIPLGVTGQTMPSAGMKKMA